eukprot:1160838-Pelagomonas_calceolata.AAC.5
MQIQWVVGHPSRLASRPWNDDVSPTCDLCDHHVIILGMTHEWTMLSQGGTAISGPLIINFICTYLPPSFLACSV